MCDTLVALGNSTADGNTIFGKNSDRDPNEAHELILIPAAEHPGNSKVKCTYIEIAQVPQTNRVLLAKPFWIWGAEMGSNEHGVTIGNEAVFTKTPYQKTPGLTGMDMLRLALERSNTATSALELIIALLEEHGQGGNCGFAHKIYYHNSFLICDPREAWVLETSGREWAAEKVRDIRSISNVITIGSEWDMASKNLVDNAYRNGWCKRGEVFSFSRCYSDFLYTTFSDARQRHTCTTGKLAEQKGLLTPADFMRILRSHEGDNDATWTPEKGVAGADVCMHASWGPIRINQTTGSMVSVLSSGQPPVHWVTGTAAPCTSLFKPVWMDTGLPETGNRPTGEYDPATLFWRHEVVHRSVLRDYSSRIGNIRRDQVSFEGKYLQEVADQPNAPVSRRGEITATAFAEAGELETRWTDKAGTEWTGNRTGLLYRKFWNQLDGIAKMQ
jgi:dipeptidase